MKKFIAVLVVIGITIAGAKLENIRANGEGFDLPPALPVGNVAG